MCIHKQLKKNWLITTNFTSNKFNYQKNSYLSLIKQASRKYGVKKSLIFAIIQTESNFNPYAMSQSNAFGLMQIMPYSAGKDVFTIIGKKGIPSVYYLFNPKNNINIGTAYLSVLQNVYLDSIINPISKNYIVIVAYNSGIANSLNIFSKNQIEAFEMINNMQPKDVYKILYTKHPLKESRQYLYKIINLQKQYRY